MLTTLIPFSCVKDPKDIPSGFTGDPVFGLQGTFGNENVTIGAGEGQWTMLPVVNQNDSLTIYSAVMSQGGCIDQCPGSWTFHFFQSTPLSAVDSTAFFNTIKPGAKDFVQPATTLDSFDITLNTHPGLFMSGYSYWENFNGDTIFEHEYNTLIESGAELNVCFESFAYTGCQYSQCISFNPATIVPCLASLDVVYEVPRYVGLSVRPEGTPPFTYEWFNDAATQSIVVPVTDSVAEIYAGVKVTDALGNTSELRQKVRVQNGVVDACYFPVSLTSIPLTFPAELVLPDKVEVVYTDTQGDLWRSSSGMQLPGYQTVIHSVTPYGFAPDGKKAYLLECSMQVLLYNEKNGEAKLFTTEQLSIALSHP